MKNFTNCLLVFLFIFTAHLCIGQNVGVGTTSPKARLHVAGNLKTDSAIVVTPIAKAAAASISISNNAGYVNITSTNNIQANAITMSGTAHAGQMLCIMNNDDDNASFASVSIPAGKLVMFTYTGTAWKAVSVSSVTTLADADEDTKIQVEESADEDIIRFDLAGTEKWVMKESRLEPSNTGKSTFIGFEAGLNDDLSANENTAIGYQSLKENTEGIRNMASGVYALRNNSTGLMNTACGPYAMYFNTEGSNNTACGFALYKNTTGYDNTACGAYTLTNNTTGYANTASGRGALNDNSEGHANTGSGYQALYKNKTGSGNVALGYRAGYNETGSDKLYIDNSNTSSPLIYGNFSSDILEINGDLRPGTDNAKKLGGSSNRWTAVYATNGTIQTSDVRFKKNIESMTYGLHELMALRSVTYQWKEDSLDETKLGFIAQELEQIVPEVVSIGTDSMQTRGVNYSELIPVLVRAIQEQQAQIENYKGQAVETEMRLSELETKLNMILNTVSANTKQ